MSRLVALLVAAAVTAAVVLVGWLGQDDPEGPGAAVPDGTTSRSGSPTATSSPDRTGAASQPSRGEPVPRPPDDACYRLTYDDAVAPTVDQRPVPCRDRHSSETFLVGTLDTVVDGHLLAVDSRRVQEQVAGTCPSRFAGFVGGTVEQRRLSMLRTVWFTPSLEASDRGADWFRCDVIAVADDEQLADLTGSVQGVLTTEAGRDRYGMCGTAEPGTDGFRRVICSAEHTWRAVRTVPFAQGRYPGEAQVRAAGETPCEEAGRAAAEDPLDFSWGYEWPTADQWDDGQTYGTCWVPD